MIYEIDICPYCELTRCECVPRSGIVQRIQVEWVGDEAGPFTSVLRRGRSSCLCVAEAGGPNAECPDHGTAAGCLCHPRHSEDCPIHGNLWNESPDRLKLVE